jgi:predicted alpha/beta-fold hydrolase
MIGQKYNNMPIINSTFKPAWWLSNPHIQTLWPTFFRRLPEVNTKIHRLELVDGDFLDLAITPIKNKPIVIILHGLEGSLNSPYAKPLIKALDEAGYGVCFVHFRGCSGEVNRLPRSYHSGDTGDLQSVVEYLQGEFSQGVFAVIGFSLGGNALLKWMGEQGNKAPVKTAIAVSVPFVLSDAGDRLEKSFSRVYQKHLVSRCQIKYQQKFATKTSPLSVDVKTLNTFYSFDDQVTAPLNGFKGADDYYTKCSSRPFLKDIHKPTLILHAKDDPFMWKHTVPNEVELSDAVHLELSDHGGHVGFVNGSHPLNVGYWLDIRIVKWLNDFK